MTSKTLTLTPLEVQAVLNGLNAKVTENGGWESPASRAVRKQLETREPKPAKARPSR